MRVLMGLSARFWILLLPAYSWRDSWPPNQEVERARTHPDCAWACTSRQPQMIGSARAWCHRPLLSPPKSEDRCSWISSSNSWGTPSPSAPRLECQYYIPRHIVWNRRLNHSGCVSLWLCLRTRCLPCPASAWARYSSCWSPNGRSCHRYLGRGQTLTH